MKRIEKILVDCSMDPMYNKAGTTYFNQEINDKYYTPVNATSSINAELLAIKATLFGGMSYKGKDVLIDSKSALRAIGWCTLSPYSDNNKRESMKLYSNVFLPTARIKWQI